MATSATYLTLRARAVPASVRTARTAVGDMVSELAGSRRVADDARLCVSEAVSNVVRHAYGPRRGEVEVAVERLDGEVEIVVRDNGVGLTRTKRRGAPGGYGLAIIERLARRYSISSRPDEGTEVRMAFAVDSSSQGASPE